MNNAGGDFVTLNDWTPDNPPTLSDPRNPSLVGTPIDPNANPLTAVITPTGIVVSHDPLVPVNNTLPSVVDTAHTTVTNLLTNLTGIPAKIEAHPMLAIGVVGAFAYFMFSKKKGGHR